MNVNMSEISAYIDRFLAGYRHYKSYWNYEDGCVLIGCMRLFEATGEKKYFDFIRDYVEPLITDDGTIVNYQTGQHNIDGFNAGKVLFLLYDVTKNDKYKRAAEFLAAQLHEQPRTNSGSFIHKGKYPSQVWLDGLYMAQPFYMQYETAFNKLENYNDILGQFRNVRKYMFDEQKQLYYHAWDEARVQPWANSETGLSPNFWLRSMGWYVMALTDTIEAMSEEIYEQYRELCDLLKEALYGLLNYRDKDTGLFFQVIDHADAAGNYTETSGSSMVACAIMKACRLGIISEEKYGLTGAEIFDSIISNKLRDGHLTDICLVAGLGPGEERSGSVEYYLSEPRVSDDSKGVGPFMMAYAEYIRLYGRTMQLTQLTGETQETQPKQGVTA